MIKREKQNQKNNYCSKNEINKKLPKNMIIFVLFVSNIVRKNKSGLYFLFYTVIDKLLRFCIQY